MVYLHCAVLSEILSWLVVSFAFFHFHFFSRNFGLENIQSRLGNQWRIELKQRNIRLTGLSKPRFEKTTTFFFLLSTTE
ncbi:hypothetical protein QBC44DRAFT_320663 [Cladorrhinum sp. PSN332]|nr:hypothetical protein QBC44DRAFT_320663 [Cladorrhinum sp. PSN332]